MEVRTQIVEMTRTEIYGHVKRLAKRGAETESRATKQFLFEAAATLDNYLWATSAEVVRFEARVGWLRMIGLVKPEAVTEDA